ncbi:MULTISPECIES: TMEM165/GDT1 family protein [unclassified Crossiella]|uniref:TMEM165/GDT1 family protein n=1 Tax=unclassified Crossiella TaxID=2620835 RepID=UPI00200018DC|nr:MULTISPECIES: TMEM165/GDT1 family protein [unclassified Crossiella]MCK2236359.1 TMEM165/GDT1 family protein [Crossiella sp. S99.2]MCK2250026.1 TMEM165/GDT1 family protein [Crossiella sp. S99.1]
MTFSLLALGAAFALVLPVELPDKTLIATLVLTTRYRAWPVFIGVTAAFAVQCVIAVAFGSALTLLPPQLVAAVVALMFGIGAFMLLREGFRKVEQGEDDAAGAGEQEVPAWRATLTSFGVLFAAEWGDASQLAIAALTARYAAPLEVGLGAFLALVTVAAIAVLVGRKVRHRLPTHLIQRVAGGVFTVFALLAAGQAVFGG